ncbi:hypothetical protein FLONG3_9876 [Fusarium longipes]|uniref:Uncharacterized protein n=1 Tax=Fusarium longipes TaxID=694270 RepID=A0A395RUL1_9HYPO|nr:hypothetical protein FLONG3_9876 [Fusarium longipes]
MKEQLQRAEETVKASKNKTEELENKLQKANADIEIATAREEDLKSKLTKAEELLKVHNFTNGHQTPVAFGAPGPISRPRPATVFNHAASKSEQIPQTSMFGSSIQLPAPTQNFWPPIPSTGNMKPQQE